MCPSRCAIPPETKGVRPEKLGDTPAAVSMKLAYDAQLCSDITEVIIAKIRGADDECRKSMADQLKQYLAKCKEEIRKEDPTLSAETNLVYIEEEDRIVYLMRDQGLS